MTEGSDNTATDSDNTASTSEAAASTSESTASASESTASASEAAASTSEAAASTSETAASTSETAASTSETAASTSETAAIDSEDDAEPVEPEEFQVHRSAHPPGHHPPPPPSLRPDRRVKETTGPDARFEVSATPRLARDLMTRKLFTIEPETPLKRLEGHMDSYRFRHLPVVEGDKLVGLITHGDLLHASSSFLSARAKERNEIIHQLPASRIMQRELITVKPTDTLDDIARLMWESRLRCVLVVEDDNKLVGIITESDFLRVAHHFLSKRAAEPST